MLNDNGEKNNKETEILLDYRFLKAIDSIIGRLKNVERLRIKLEHLGWLPDAIGDLENLKRLRINFSELEQLPDTIGNLKSLEYLNLLGNKLQMLPDTIGNLTNLKFLMLWTNRLLLLPDTIENLKSLERLILVDNQLERLPDGIGGLESLQMLWLNDNSLDLLPDTIGDLRNLQRLLLSNNRLRLVPDAIGFLENLQHLWINGNHLSLLPETLGDLKNLEYLNLGTNSLEALPDTMKNLDLLRVLYLCGNRFSAFPSVICCLNKLNYLNLQSNQLTLLPSEIRNLKHTLVFLDLRDNSIAESGGEAGLGKLELREIFGRRVIFDGDRIETDKSEIPVSSVYKDLKAQPVYWNFEMLRSIRLSAIPDIRYSEKDIMKIWNESISRPIVDKNKRVIEEFIRHIYNPDVKVLEELYSNANDDDYVRRVSPEYIYLARNLIGAIFNILLEKCDEQAAISSINAICKGLEYGPDRQISEMVFVYYLLTGGMKEDNLEEFVRSIIRWEKERVLCLTWMPKTAFQSECILDFWRHFLDSWKHNLRDDIGFDIEFSANAVHECMNEMDRFKGWKGNGLSAFYTKFTPESVIGKVTEQINSKDPMVRKAAQMLYSDLRIRDKSRMYVSKSGDILDMSGVTEEFVKYLLLRMGVIVERKPLLQRCFGRMSDVLWRLVSCEWCGS